MRRIGSVVVFAWACGGTAQLPNAPATTNGTPSPDSNITYAYNVDVTLLKGSSAVDCNVDPVETLWLAVERDGDPNRVVATASTDCADEVTFFLESASIPSSTRIQIGSFQPSESGNEAPDTGQNNLQVEPSLVYLSEWMAVETPVDGGVYDVASTLFCISADGLCDVDDD